MKKLEKLLFQAISANDTEKVKFLVKEKGVNVNIAATQAKITPLMVAARENFASMVTLLLELDADIDAEDYIGRDAIQYALKYNAGKAFVALLEGDE